MNTSIRILLSVSIILSAYCSKQRIIPADIIIHNAEVYTMEKDHPWAWGVAVRKNRIQRIFYRNEPSSLKPYVGQQTRVIDLKGKFVLPGFIDGHVHFNRAGAMIADINLMKVADDQGLIREVKRVVDNLQKGEWITGGLWGAYEAWELGAANSTGNKGQRWLPRKALIDSITEHNSCLLASFDGAFFLANSQALANAGLLKKTLEGMTLDRNGYPTGLIARGSPALERIRALITPKSRERLLNENRAALKHLARCGIVEVHDIATPDQTRCFVTLEKNGELTCRIWLRPDLSQGKLLIDKGFTMGIHPESRSKSQWLRYGALKGYIDGIMGTHGALFFKPYDDQPDNYGHYRRHTSDHPRYLVANMDKMYRMIKAGYQGGFVSNVHAIGNKGVSLMLDTYERLKKELRIDLRGFRVIHAQVVRPQDFIRFQKLNVIAEVNPYHIADDMRWMEERIGSDRSKWAYAFQSLLRNNAQLSFGSDWPGTSAAEYFCHPKYLIHAAVNRTTINGKPDGGWFPEQKISVEEALKAYTINNAYAVFEEDIRGSIKEGKLADITVCDRNLLNIDPAEILDMRILLTMVDGRIVYRDL